MTAQKDVTVDATGAATFDTAVREAEPLLVADGPYPDDAHSTDDIDNLPLRLGADSLVWKFYGDIRGIVGFQRLAGTENCIEQLAQGVADHSVIFNDFIGRARRTAPPVMRTVYAEDPYRWGRMVRDFHRDIKGTISDGSRYHALNPELYYWAHATFVDQVLTITDTFIRRLSEAEKEQIFQESKVWYSLYGVSARSQPQTYAEFRAYWDGMLDRFAPNPTILYATGYLRKGVPGPRWIPGRIWSVLSKPLNGLLRTVIVGTLPQQMRDVCGLDWDDRKQRRFERFSAAVRALNPVFNRLPLKWLYLPWAYEAWQRTGVDPRRLHNRR